MCMEQKYHYYTLSLIYLPFLLYFEPPDSVI